MLTDRTRALIARQNAEAASVPAEPTRPLSADRITRERDRVQITPRRSSELSAAIATRERVQRRLLAGAEGFAALTALSLAALVTHALLSWQFVLVVPAVIVIAKLQGLYDRDELVIRKSTLQELPKLLENAAVTGVIVYFARDAILNGHSGTPAFFCLVALLMALLMPVSRVCARRIARRLVAPEQCLVVGDEVVLARLQQRMVGVKGTTLVGAIPSDELPMSAGGLQDLATRLKAHRLIIAPRSPMHEDQIADLISFARAAGLRVSVSPGVMAAFGGGRAVDQFGGYTIVGVPHFGLSRSSAAIKRAFDVLSAAVAIIVFAPVMLVAAVWIKLDTPGAVLFRQTRVGRDGGHFSIWKLRSMVEDAEALKPDLLHLNEAEDGLFKIAADPRVTRSGAVLRRTHADELPQLFNVLRGEMSLVGPRPLVVEEDERIVGRDRHRLHLMPGMTGPWQSLGRSSHVLPIGEMAKLDYMYVANWSLWEDVCILLRTVGMVAGGRGV